jgi:NAD(P)-dependent dehydrogenase (short-subunit alcohol dehydrogenase family)
MVHFFKDVNTNSLLGQAGCGLPVRRAAATLPAPREKIMTKRLENKIAIVTGAGSSGPGWGNGKAAAVLYAREGARVLAADLRQEAAGETYAIIAAEGGTCLAFAGDVTKTRDVEARVAACLAAFGRVDVLHNNVGIVEVGGPVEASEES